MTQHERRREVRNTIGKFDRATFTAVAGLQKGKHMAYTGKIGPGTRKKLARSDKV